MSTVEFTKYMVAKGTKELLQTRDFEEISVGEIARHCHISRNTFYYHFKDKYDVINWIFYSEITPIIGESQSMDNWAKNGMEGDPEPVVRMLEDLLSGDIFDKLIALQHSGDAQNH